MLRRFFKDSFIYGLSGVLTKGITLFLIPFYTRVFTTDDYGVIDLIAIVSQIVAITFPLQITQAIARFYPECNTHLQKQKYASTALFFTFFSLLLFLGLYNLFIHPLETFLFDSENYTNILRIAGINIFFNGLYYYFQNLLKWRLEPKNT